MSRLFGFHHYLSRCVECREGVAGIVERKRGQSAESVVFGNGVFPVVQMLAVGFHPAVNVVQLPPVPKQKSVHDGVAEHVVALVEVVDIASQPSRQFRSVAPVAAHVALQLLQYGGGKFFLFDGLENVGTTGDGSHFSRNPFVQPSHALCLKRTQNQRKQEHVENQQSRNDVERHQREQYHIDVGNNGNGCFLNAVHREVGHFVGHLLAFRHFVGRYCAGRCHFQAEGIFGGQFPDGLLPQNGVGCRFFRIFQPCGELLAAIGRSRRVEEREQAFAAEHVDVKRVVVVRVGVLFAFRQFVKFQLQTVDVVLCPEYFCFLYLFGSRKTVAEFCQIKKNYQPCDEAGSHGGCRMPKHDNGCDRCRKHCQTEHGHRQRAASEPFQRSAAFREGGRIEFVGCHLVAFELL